MLLADMDMGRKVEHRMLLADMEWKVEQRVLMGGEQQVELSPQGVGQVRMMPTDMDAAADAAAAAVGGWREEMEREH